MCVQVARIVYGGMKDGRLADKSVCLGLDNASRRLRDGWMAARGNRRRSSHQLEARHASPKHQRDDRLLRDGVLYESDEGELLIWVPCVHFGV